MPKDYLEASAEALNNEPKKSIFTFSVMEKDEFNFLVTVDYILIDKQQAINELTAIEYAARLAAQKLR